MPQSTASPGRGHQGQARFRRSRAPQSRCPQAPAQPPAQTPTRSPAHLRARSPMGCSCSRRLLQTLMDEGGHLGVFGRVNGAVFAGRRFIVLGCSLERWRGTSTSRGSRGSGSCGSRRFLIYADVEDVDLHSAAGDDFRSQQTRYTPASTVTVPRKSSYTDWSGRSGTRIAGEDSTAVSSGPPWPSVVAALTVSHQAPTWQSSMRAIHWSQRRSLPETKSTMAFTGCCSGWVAQSAAGASKSGPSTLSAICWNQKWPR